MPSLITNDWCQLFSAFSVSAPLYQIWYVLKFISVTGVYDEHLSQAGAVLTSCVLTSAQLHIYLTWVQHTVKWTMLDDPSEVNTWKWYSLSFRWPSSPVEDVSSIPIILFDTIVVFVTLAGTLGTWRVYKRSAWKMLTLAHLLAEQSM